MKSVRNQTFLLILAVAVLSMCTREQDGMELSDVSPEESMEVMYDSTLAAELGADDYGMRRYVMAFLKSGPNRPENPDEAARLQRAHLDNISRLAEEGSLVVAGPFLDDTEIRGIYIFAVESVEEARALSESDPAIQAGSLELELHPWYGSAALMQIGEIHSSISRESP
ncbi:MAG: YciI family protein [Balneolaceae bacterium]|nr:YciI family protein [Balneolaceae bacterium]